MPRRTASQATAAPAVVRPTPALRRGIFVAFLVLGMFLALSYINGERANKQLERSEAREQRATQQNERLLRRVDEVLADNEAAARERAALNRLLVRLLASSQDPAVAEAFGELQEQQEAERERTQAGQEPSGGTDTPTPSRPRSGGQQDGENEDPEPRRTPRPQPQPRPTPRPTPQPAPQEELVCVQTGPPLNRRICTPL